MESNKSTQTTNRYIAIMAGGIGSRFWPASTAERPKQFLDILGVGKSLLRMTFERSLRLVPAENIFIVTNKRYKGLVCSQLPELPEQNVLCEPTMNNTAPCIAYTALRIQANDPSAVFAVLPSDHVILKEDQYSRLLEQAMRFAEAHEAIVTLGIKPSRPDTGYGYIEVACDCVGRDQQDPSVGICRVASFKEKPDSDTAEKYLRSGNYLWNAGMFVWSVKTLLDSFVKNAPDILAVLSEDPSFYGTPGEQAYIDRVYPNTENISVDFAILERSDNVFVLPADIGWSDLGTWNSLHDYLDKDGNDTVSIGSNTFLFDTKNSIIRSDSKKIVVVKGLENYIVVDEEDALLIYPKNDEQEIKSVVKTVLPK